MFFGIFQFVPFVSLTHNMVSRVFCCGQSTADKITFVLPALRSLNEKSKVKFYNVDFKRIKI